MRLYGLTKILSFPCICFGKKGYFFKIGIGKDRKLHVYKGNITSNHVINSTSDTYPRSWFIGLVINDTERGYLTYENKNYEKDD